MLSMSAIIMNMVSISSNIILLSYLYFSCGINITHMLLRISCHRFHRFPRPLFLLANLCTACVDMSHLCVSCLNKQSLWPAWAK
ncbi:hypothetical protein BDF19DRAFT_447534 [Syncephalis fuscata]|nr:hypothetical protein BDF19DRAFT_447534 [Syncephalis fuscata]